MRRLTFGSVLLVALALAGCDLVAKLKGGGDAGAAAPAPVIAAEGDAAAPPATAATTAPTAPATLTPPTPLPTGPHPVVIGDAGPHAADAGHLVDGGHVAPSPTPMPTIPPIPPIPFDAGALRLPDGGFKPPWVH